MAGEIYTAAKTAYPLQPVIDGKGPYVPKEAVLTLFQTIQEQVDIAQEATEGAAAGYVIGVTWAALAAINGTRAGQPGRVPASDTGTHTDPVVGGTVPNSGEFAWSVSPAGWRRVGDVLDAAALQADIDAQFVEFQEDLESSIGSNLLDEIYDDAVLASDEATVLLGYRKDGTVDVNETYPLLDGEWLYAEVAADGKTVLRGIFMDGSAYPSSDSSSDNSDAVTYVASDGNVIVYENSRRSPITFDGGPYLAPKIFGDFATYLRDTAGVVTEYSEEIKASSSLVAITSVLHHLVYGQSLGYGTSGTPVQTTSPIRTGRAAMFNIGPRANGDSTDQANPISADKQYALVDLKEITAETVSSGIAYKLTESGALNTNEGVILSVHARGSTTYLNLKKGTGPYANVLRSARRAHVISSLRGIAYDARYVSWIHGETDRDKTQAVYKGYLVELQADLTTDLNPISGNSGQVIVVGDQTSSWTAFGQATSEVPFAQLQAAIENPTKILCVGPKYHLPHRTDDGIHLPGPSYRRLGCYHGRMTKRHRAGQDTLPLYCTGASRSGAVITLAMHVPVGPLVIDTTAVSNPGNNGLTWTQVGGTARTISSVAVSGANIVVTLSGDPGAITSGSIGVAASGTSGALGGPTTGPRSNFRDSSADLDVDGVAMPNWACHQIISVS